MGSTAATAIAIPLVSSLLANRDLENVKNERRVHMAVLRPIFIAEASSNHGRELSRALAFVDAAAEAGCDAVKFQLFKVDRMFAPEILSRSAKHHARNDWELPLDHLAPLAEHCSQRRIAFSCTPFYLEAVEALRPHVAFYKMAS